MNVRLDICSVFENTLILLFPMISDHFYSQRLILEEEKLKA